MFRDTITHWLSNASGENKIEVIVSVDDNDPQLDNYKREIDYLPHGILLLINRNRSCIDAVNIGAKASTGDLLIVVSDDFRCPKDWDKTLVERTKGKEFFVVKTDDGTQGWIITLPIMDRAFYKRFGYIYPPAYKHMFCDTEMTAVGDMLDCTINMKDVLFEHVHYTTGKTQRDAINIRNDSTWNQGQNMYIRRYKNNFFLNPSEIKGRIKDEEHVKWLNKRINRG